MLHFMRSKKFKGVTGNFVCKSRSEEIGRQIFLGKIDLLCAFTRDKVPPDTGTPRILPLNYLPSFACFSTIAIMGLRKYSSIGVDPRLLFRFRFRLDLRKGSID